MSSKRNKILALGLAAVVFLLGFVSGVGAGPFLMGPPPDRHGPEAMLARYQRELDLTAEQSRKIAPIAEARWRETAELFESIDPQASAIHRRANDEIRAVLTPEQGERFDAMVERFRERRAGMRSKLDLARKAKTEAPR